MARCGGGHYPLRGILEKCLVSRIMPPMDSFRQQFAVAKGSVLSILALTGLWAQQAWIFWMNTQGALAVSTFPWQGSYLVMGLVMWAAAAAAGSVRGKRGP